MNGLYIKIMNKSKKSTLLVIIVIFEKIFMKLRKDFVEKYFSEWMERMERSGEQMIVGKSGEWVESGVSLTKTSAEFHFNTSFGEFLRKEEIPEKKRNS